MSSGFAGSPGDGAAPGAVGGVRSEGGSARGSRERLLRRGGWIPGRREGGATRIRHRRSRVAFTCIFHLSFRGVALPGSTYNPPSNQRALPTISRAPADSHWPRRIDVAANPSSSPPRLYFIILLTYPTRLRRWRWRWRCMCAPFSVLLSTTSWRRCTRGPGREGGRLRSYLRYENATPTIFLLFRRYRRLRRILDGRTAGGLCFSSSSWPLPLASSLEPQEYPADLR